MINKSRERRLAVLTILFALLIPLANVFLLGSLQVILGSDIAYPQIIAELLGYVSEIISVGCVFAYSACIAFALMRKITQKAVIMICVLSVPIMYAASAIVDYVFFDVSAMGESYAGFIVTSCLFELLRLAAVIAVCLSVRSGTLKKGRPDTLELFDLSGGLSRAISFTAITVFISLIITKLTDTFMLFAEYGAPININEVIYLILPYVTVIVYSLLGYLLMYLVSLFALERRTKQGGHK